MARIVLAAALAALCLTCASDAPDPEPQPSYVNPWLAAPPPPERRAPLFIQPNASAPLPVRR